MMVMVMVRAFPRAPAETRSNLQHHDLCRPVIELQVEFDLSSPFDGRNRIDQHQVVATRLHGQSATGRDDEAGENLHACQTFDQNRAMHLDQCESRAGHLDQGTAIGTRILQRQVAGKDPRSRGWFRNPAIDQPQFPQCGDRTQRQHQQQPRQTPPGGLSDSGWRVHARTCMKSNMARRRSARPAGSCGPVNIPASSAPGLMRKIAALW